MPNRSSNKREKLIKAKEVVQIQEEGEKRQRQKKEKTTRGRGVIKVSLQHLMEVINIHQIVITAFPTRTNEVL